MSRPIKLREDGYDRDAQVILRIIGAVKKDTQRTPEWRESVVENLSNAVRLLMVPSENTSVQTKAAGSRGRR